MQAFITLLCLLLPLVESQKIQDIWQTTRDRKSLFKSLNPITIPFKAKGSTASTVISIDAGKVHQTIDGFGATLTDTSAQLLTNLKKKNAANYKKLLRKLYDPTYSANAAGFQWLRVPLGATDFSPRAYSFDGQANDKEFTRFSVDSAPACVFEVLKDILAISPKIKVQLIPWSPPAWMKTSGTILGGSLKENYISTYPVYLLKCLEEFKSKGVTAWAISIQNEPGNQNPTVPSNKMPAGTEASIGRKLRSLMDSNGFKSTKIIGYEHNWENAGKYAVQLIKAAPDAFDGVAFHCYGGDVSQQDEFHNKYPQKGIWFTECSGTIGSDWWSDIKWNMDHIFIGSVERGSRSGLLWTLAGDKHGGPMLPGANTCPGGGCRPMVTINSDGSYVLNQEFYAAAHLSKATLPKDKGGPQASRVGINVRGEKAWALRALAFVTHRKNKKDWLQYSVVVMNWNDQDSNGAVKATIEFKGQHVTYEFPVGVTTLWWFSPPAGTTTSSKPHRRAMMQRFVRSLSG